MHLLVEAAAKPALLLGLAPVTPGRLGPRLHHAIRKPGAGALAS